MAWTVLNALLVPVLTEAATAHASGFNSRVRLGLNDWRTSLSSASVRWPDEIPQEHVRFGPRIHYSTGRSPMWHFRNYDGNLAAAFFH
jgi:hypothetical protein